MDLRIIYKDGDGVSVIAAMADAADINDIVEKDLPKGSDYKIVDVSGIHEERVFREAWKYEDGLYIDIDEAIEIQKDRWRKAREPLFEALDIEYMKASEEGDPEKIKEISEKKQVLRDVTNEDLSYIKDLPFAKLEKLKNVCPKCLSS